MRAQGLRASKRRPMAAHLSAPWKGWCLQLTRGKSELSVQKSELARPKTASDVGHS